MNPYQVIGGVGQFFGEKSAAVRGSAIATAIEAGDDMLARLKKEMRRWPKEFPDSDQTAHIEQCRQDIEQQDIEQQDIEQQDIEMAELAETIKTKTALVAGKERMG